MDVDVKSTPLSGFAMEGSRVDMERILAESPKDGLFAGIGAALLVARTAGIYTLAARLDRPAGRSADCLSRMAFGQHRLFSNLDLDVVNDVSKTFAPVRFELQPGLYWLRWAFGCWQGQRASQTGSLTILVGHPGEPKPQPGRPEDFIRPAASD